MEEQQLRKRITVHQFLKRDVIRSLKKSIQESDLAMSIYWAIELHKSGFLVDLLNTLEELQFLYCLPLNIRLLKQFQVRLNEIGERLKRDNDIVELNIEDVSTTRLVCEMTGLLAMTDKIRNRKKTKLNETDLLFNTLFMRLEYGGSNQLNGIWESGDPTHLRMFFNEFAGSLMNRKSSMLWQWWDWLNNWELEQKKNKKPPTKTAGRMRTNDETIQSLIANIMSRDDKLGPILKIALNIYQCDVLYKKMSATQNLKRFVYILEGVLNFIVFPVDLEKPLCGNTELLRLTMTEVTSKWAQE